MYARLRLYIEASVLRFFRRLHKENAKCNDESLIFVPSIELSILFVRVHFFRHFVEIVLVESRHFMIASSFF